MNWMYMSVIHTSLKEKAIPVRKCVDDLQNRLTVANKMWILSFFLCSLQWFHYWVGFGVHSCGSLKYWTPYQYHTLQGMLSSCDCSWSSSTIQFPHLCLRSMFSGTRVSVKEQSVIFSCLFSLSCSAYRYKRYIKRVVFNKLPTTLVYRKT